ncbi:FecR/PupR family sigma factor regulator, partial [Achromobacter ruhlandii]
MTSAAMPPDAVVRQAIAWWARLQSGIADAGEREACQAWLAQDPAHRKAWERLETIGRDARRAPAAPAHTAPDGPAQPGRPVPPRNLPTHAALAAAGSASSPRPLSPSLSPGAPRRTRRRHRVQAAAGPARRPSR